MKTMRKILEDAKISDPDYFIEQIIDIARRREFKSSFLGSEKILMLENQEQDGLMNILVAGGFHGDEPAGPYGILSFLRNFNKVNCNLTILPLVSRSAFKLGTHLNQWKENANRGYTDNKLSHEGKILLDNLSLFRKKSENGFLTLHEDFEEKGFYIYSLEKKDTPCTITKMIFETGSKLFGLPVNTDPAVGEMKGGIIHNDFNDSSFESRLFKDGLAYALVTETPGTKEFGLRVKVNENIIKKFIQ